MPTYTLLSGEKVAYLPPPAVADFIARVHAAVADPGVGVSEVVELIYGPGNPILDRTMIPGRPVVTKAVFDSPEYKVLADLLQVKRVQVVGMVMPDSAYTVSVPDAADRLGITPSAVRAAIAGKKLDARQVNGEWLIRDESVGGYRVSNRGRKAEPRVLVAYGSEPGRSLSVSKPASGTLKVERVRRPGPEHIHTAQFAPGWTGAVIRTTAEGGKVRVFKIVPAEGADEEIAHGSFYVRGPFQITARENNAKRASELWTTITGR
jgi:hypothetical protein